MKFLSVCSGIEAASIAWEPLGFEPISFAEIEKFPSAVLAHHWPEIPNLGDMTKFHEWPDTLRPDILIGGTPCQSFSVAGLRKGLRDPRGNLTLVFLGIVEKYRPPFVVWENVPGVLSSEGGRDFASFLGGLEQLGYEWCFRVLDAQYFGVPQRRRRVFVVASPRGRPHPSKILFEPESLQRDLTPSREKGKVSPTLPSRSTGGGGLGTDFDLDGGLIAPPLTTNPYGDHESREGLLVPQTAGALCPGAHPEGVNGQDAYNNMLIPTVSAKWAKGSGGPAGDECQNLIPTTQYGNKARTLTARHDSSPCSDRGQNVVACFNPAVVFGIEGQNETAHCLRSEPSKADKPSSTTYVSQNLSVRRLTPRECERLQGFPDDHTLIPWRGKSAAKCPDGPRYKAIGNSMAVPVIRWIGQRIKTVSKVAP